MAELMITFRLAMAFPLAQSPAAYAARGLPTVRAPI